MKAGEQSAVMPMTRRPKNREADSLWNETRWQEMRKESSKIPETLEEALALGYALGTEFNYQQCGGVLNHEFMEGYFELVSEFDANDLPMIRLPFRARLEFGKPYVKEQSTGKKESE
jgi:hypothetical protein